MPASVFLQLAEMETFFISFEELTGWKVEKQSGIKVTL